MAYRTQQGGGGSSLFSLLVLILVIAAQLYVIYQICRSRAPTPVKVCWSLIVFFFPLMGMVFWACCGPKETGGGHVQHRYETGQWPGWQPDYGKQQQQQYNQPGYQGEYKEGGYGQAPQQNYGYGQQPPPHHGYGNQPPVVYAQPAP